VLCVCMYVYVCLYAVLSHEFVRCAYVCMYVCVCVYAVLSHEFVCCAYVCMCVMYVCMYVYVSTLFLVMSLCAVHHTCFRASLHRKYMCSLGHIYAYIHAYLPALRVGSQSNTCVASVTPMHTYTHTCIHICIESLLTP
jgi:hypothetical protein